jgi:hypothetical protein
MPVEIAAMAVNVSKLANKPGQQNEQLVEELVREVIRLCKAIQKLEQRVTSPRVESSTSGT